MSGAAEESVRVKMKPIYIDYLNALDIDALAMTDGEIIAAVEAGLVAQGKGQTVIEPRVHLEPDPSFHGHFNVLRGYVAPLDTAQAEAAIRRLAEGKPESVAICFLHSYANQAHEREVAAIVRRLLPDVYVALSSDIWPEYQEYERASTAVLSAYVGPNTPEWVHWAAVVVVTATCLVWQAGLALAFSSLRAATAYARAQKPLDRGAAGLMGAFGLSLLWTAG